MNSVEMATLKGPLTADELGRLHSYWRAANYLSVGQIYLYDNPLLREPLKLEHVKPRLLGHWGTTPGLNFVYAHLNRAIMARNQQMIFITGPGHGGPGVVASSYLEGTYSEIYPEVTRDEAGLRRLFRQFSSPGGILLAAILIHKRLFSGEPGDNAGPLSPPLSIAALPRRSSSARRLSAPWQRRHFT